MLTLAGLTAQWLSLRDLHWSASVAQASAVCTMTLIRTQRGYNRRTAAAATKPTIDPAIDSPSPARLTLAQLADRAGLRATLTDAAEVLLARGIAAIDEHTAHGRTMHADWCLFWLLHYAGDPRVDGDLVRERLAAHIDDLDVQMGGTPPERDVDLEMRASLTAASIANNAPLVASLLASGAHPAERDFRGRTALHYAAELGHVGVLLRLLQHDQSYIDARDSAGCTAGQLAAGAVTQNALLFYGCVERPSECREGVHAAVWRGAKSAVALVLQRDAEAVHERDQHGDVPLHTAVAAGGVGVVQVLRRCGADVDVRGARGETALYRAVVIGNVRVLRVLLAAGADAECVCEAGKTPLVKAVEAGSAGVVSVLVGHIGAVLDSDGALMRAAAASGSAEVVLFIIRHAAGDVHSACPRTGETPLHVASSPQAALALLTHGADIAATTRTRQTPLHLAASRGAAAVIALLISHGAAKDARNLIGETAVHSAAAAGHPAAVTALLAHGAIVDATNIDIETPLHRASQEGHADVITVLLASGASVHAVSHPRKTALHMASRGGHAMCLELLLRHGSTLHARDITGQTALHMAASYGHIAALEVLLARATDVAATDEHARTPLHLAAEDAHRAAVKALLRRGGAVAAVDEWGQTPLHGAAAGGHVATMQVLVEGGASHAAVDSDAMTPLHLAARAGRVPAVRALLMVGADPEARSYWGETPVQLAQRGGRGEVVRVLVEWSAERGV